LYIRYITFAKINVQYCFTLALYEPYTINNTVSINKYRDYSLSQSNTNARESRNLSIFYNNIPL